MYLLHCYQFYDFSGSPSPLHIHPGLGDSHGLHPHHLHYLQAEEVLYQQVSEDMKK